jgi:hypothetical protein
VKLHLNGVTQQQFEHVVPHCITLEELHVQVDGGWSDPRPDEEQTVRCQLPYLREFSLEYYGSDDSTADQILSGIQSPCLQKLTLRYTTPMSLEVLANFVRQCSSTLTDIDLPDLYPWEIGHLLEFTPQIKVLRLCCDSVSNDLLLQLAKAEGDSRLLPHLHQLTIGGGCELLTVEHENLFAENRFMHMVRSRVPDEHRPSFNILGEQLLCKPLRTLNLCEGLSLSKQSSWEIDERFEV